MKATTLLYATLTAVLATGLLLACAPTTTVFTDEEISLRKEGMLVNTEAPKLVYAGLDAGENKTLPRAFYGAPPMIPHLVEGTVFGLEANDCLDCHEEADEDTPGLPTTHRIKALFKVRDHAQAQQGMLTTFEGFAKVDLVSGSRYNCMLCHAPQAANTPPLVGNSFIPHQPSDDTPDALEQLNSVGQF